MDDEHSSEGQRLRNESDSERLDRNWNSLLQELRVAQTGVQVLTGFLLMLPFQQRFDLLDHTMEIVYMVTVSASVLSTVLLVAPVAMHRLLFRRRRLVSLVEASHRSAYAGLLLLGVAMTGMTAIVFEAVSGRSAALIAGGCALGFFTLFWLFIPLRMRNGAHRLQVPETPRATD